MNDTKVGTRLRRGALAVVSVLAWTSQALADDEHHTPRAGEAYSGTVFGRQIDLPERDRTKATALDFGILWLPDGPDKKKINPFATVFLWRNWDDGKRRLRAIVVGLYDNIRFDFLPSRGPFEMLVTSENLTPPFDRSEYVEGVRIESEALRWYQGRLGVGAGLRIPLAPGHQDNALEAALSYEPGFQSFSKGDETDPGFIVPQKTYEDRLHFRFRADAIERNFMELPHDGIAAGLDATHGRRATWEDWGDPALGLQDASRGKEWNTLSFFVVGALPVPFVRSERHRLITSVYAGKAADVDRFSAFRIGDGPTTADWEYLSRVILPGTASEETVTDAYGILNLEYRYELLFFAYLRVKGTLAQVDRLRFTDTGGTANRLEPMNALSIGVTTGFLWHSLLELNYSYNFGALRQRDGVTRTGDDAILFHWSKSFSSP